MRIWACCSQKGGVGKTSLSVHLATYAVASGERAVIIDLDPQENAKAWHTRRGDDNMPPMVIPAVIEKLGKVLEAAETLGMSLVIIDTAGKIDSVALSVMRAADLIITPTLPNFFDMDALRGTVALLRQVGKLDQAVCVINGVHHQNKDQDFADAKMQAENIGIRVSPAFCVYRRAFARAIEEGKGVTEFAKKSEPAVKELVDLWTHLNTVNPIQAKVESSKV